MQIHEGVSLRDHTTFKLGGPADFFVSVQTLEELKKAVQWAHKRGLPFFILGGGSNVVFPDEGYRGLVIRVELKGVVYKEGQDEVLVIASAGEEWDALVGETVERGLWGLENLSAIPGSVGAVPVQNVGAYGVEAKNIIEWVEVFDTETQKVSRLSVAECAFAYRDSIFKHEEGANFVVLRVAFNLSRMSEPLLSYKDVVTYFEETKQEPTLMAIRHAICTIRARKFPKLTEVGTAGSFFKNPIVSSEQAARLKEKYPALPTYDVGESTKISLAWILDNVLNLKGVCEGNVGTFQEQPLVLVTHTGAFTEELLRFANAVEEKVFAATGVRISPEVNIIRNKK
jgi:UDP-N-acetylmuramate dehydrogenase